MQNMFELLKDQITGKSGDIHFTLDNLTRKVTSTDIIGNTIQDWLPLWFDRNNIKYKTLKNTQEFPDYLLDLDSGKDMMLEVKAWNHNNNPAFDVANFESYIDIIEADPSKLYADYLIFGYSPLSDHSILIEDIFLKKVWEITGPGKSRPLTVQVKRDVIYNIRPIDIRKPNANSFQDEFEFLEAIKSMMEIYKPDKKDMNKWLTEIKSKI